MMKSPLLVFVSLFFISLQTFSQEVSGKKDSSAIQAINYAAPGRIVDANGRKLHIISSGKGSPAVVLVNGGGGFAIDWTLVQSRIDSNTRVCSYDWAGYGWSDAVPVDETVEQHIEDLHNLLKKAGEKPPYLLVGASIGGIFIQAYQRQYPKEVAGLVFTNSSGRIGMTTKTKADLIWNLTEEDIRSIYPLPARQQPSSIVIYPPYDNLPADLQKTRVWLSNKLAEKQKDIIPTPRTVLSWRKEFLREFETIQQSKTPPLGKLPVIVISGSFAAHDSLRSSRKNAVDKLDFLSANTIHIREEGKHELHLDKPATVVKAIRMALVACRKKIPLSQVKEIN